VLLLDVEGPLEHVGGRVERRLDLGVGHGLAGDLARDVAGGVEDALGVGLVVDDRCAGPDRLDLVEDGREHVVGHLDPSARLLGDRHALRGDRGDPVADVADLVVEADLVPRSRVRPALAAGGVLHAGGVERVQHRVHARQGARLGVVDGDDARVGVRAA